jgi:hypothetical protein
MKRLQKKKTRKVESSCPIGDITIKKVCYICNSEIRNTQRFYAIGKDNKGNELYRHLKCKTSDYKGV